MKTTLLIFVILFAGLQVGHSKYLGLEQEECITELNLDKDEIVRLNAQRVGPAVSSDFNNYVLCYCKKTGLMDSNGVFHYDKVIDVIVNTIKRSSGSTPNPLTMSMLKQALTPAIEECQRNSPVGSDDAETAVLGLKCVDTILRKNIS